MKRGTVGADLPDASGGEVIETLASMTGRNMRIERIISGGHASPEGFWYDQGWDEWVIVLRGRAILAFRDFAGEILEQGDWLLIPAGCAHRVESTTPETLWLAVHADG